MLATGRARDPPLGALVRLLPAVRRAATVLIAASVLAVLSPGAAHAAGTRSFAGDFPDPEVLVHRNADSSITYWAYSTNTAQVYANVPVMSSRDLRKWSARKDALPYVATWAKPGWTWAPSVIRIGSTHVMYYTVRHKDVVRQCISRAVSTNGPAGPFVDDSDAPLVCQHELGGSIDPDVVQDGNELHLHWKSDGNAIGVISRLWGARLTGDGLALAGGHVELLAFSPNTWENPLIEAPTMVRTSGGHYRLFYSGNWWESPNAGVGYAACTGSLGTCTKVTTQQRWLARDTARVGPAGQTFFRKGSTDLVAYHAWAPDKVGYANGGKRSLWIQSVSFDGSGTPLLGS